MKHLPFYIMLVASVCMGSGCNNSNKNDKPADDVTITPEAQKSYAGTGMLMLELTVDGTSIATDSARYTINEYGGMELKAWGERFTQGPYAYSYTLEVRFGTFHGKDKYPVEKEHGTMFWQYKSYYLEAGHPGSITIGEWTDKATRGQFELNMDDGYGAKKVIVGTFREM